MLAPAQFLPMVEDHPLTIEIGQWAIESVLTQIEHWQQSGLCMPVIINIGAGQGSRRGRRSAGR